jgi:hypothetical protein
MISKEENLKADLNILILLISWKALSSREDRRYYKVFPAPPVYFFLSNLSVSPLRMNGFSGRIHFDKPLLY